MLSKKMSYTLAHININDICENISNLSIFFHATTVSRKPTKRLDEAEMFFNLQ
jgi:hypothetical protein